MSDATNDPGGSTLGDRLKGRAKQAVGSVLGDDRLQREGRLQVAAEEAADARQASLERKTRDR